MCVCSTRVFANCKGFLVDLLCVCELTGVGMQIWFVTATVSPFWNLPQEIWSSLMCHGPLLCPSRRKSESVSISCVPPHTHTHTHCIMEIPQITGHCSHNCYSTNQSVITVSCVTSRCHCTQKRLYRVRDRWEHQPISRCPGTGFVKHICMILKMHRALSTWSSYLTCFLVLLWTLQTRCVLIQILRYKNIQDSLQIGALPK